MKQQYIFIDDSGDPGLKGSNTTRFIVAAVLVTNRDNLIKLSTAIDSFRAGLGWKELDEFKFSASRKVVIKDLLQHINQFDYKSYALVIDKANIATPPKFTRSETLYNYAIKELLVRLKIREPIIVVDGATDKQYVQQMRTYIRQALKSHGIKKCKVGLIDSRKEPLVQLADIIAGSVARSYDKNKADHMDYVRLLKSKMKDIYEITL